MTQAQLFTLLKTTNLQVAYREWANGATPPALPYIVYLYVDNSGTFAADNGNYVDAGNWQVELYSKTKDATNEAVLEGVLKGAKLPFGKYETFLDDEDMNQIVYTIRTM